MGGVATHLHIQLSFVGRRSFGVLESKWVWPKKEEEDEEIEGDEDMREYMFLDADTDTPLSILFL